jgi:hypothetical protein
MALGSLTWNDNEALGIECRVLPSELHESNGCGSKIRIRVIQWNLESGAGKNVETWCPDELGRRLDLQTLSDDWTVKALGFSNDQGLTSSKLWTMVAFS